VHDGPAVRRSTDDIESGAGDVYGYAEDVEQVPRAAEFLDVVPRATAQRSIDVRPQAEPIALGSHSNRGVTRSYLVIVLGLLRGPRRADEMRRGGRCRSHNIARDGPCPVTSDPSPTVPADHTWYGSPSRRSRSEDRPRGSRSSRPPTSPCYLTQPLRHRAVGPYPIQGQ